MGLTGKQKTFIDSYLGPAKFNASLAAKMAGYSATSKHSFESIGSENLTRPNIAKAISEYFRLSRMNADEVLIELTTLARGNTKDKVRALALLSAHHGILDGRGRDEEIQKLAERIADQRIQEWYNEVNADVEEYNRKAEANNRDKDKQFNRIVKRYQHNEEAVAALQLMFRVMKDYERVEGEPEPPPQPAPEIEIIPPSRRLKAAAAERLMADVIDVEESMVFVAENVDLSLRNDNLTSDRPANNRSRPVTDFPPDEPERRGLIYYSSDNDSHNTRSGFPSPCSHGYHGACSLCSARIP